MRRAAADATLGITLQLDVELDPKHLEKLSDATPLAGITELIWNAFDADATNVRVVLAENDLGGITEIRVEDDGHGMSLDEAVSGFKRLGGSWKGAAAAASPGNRPLHGKSGEGRFRAAGLGSRITWRTVSVDPADAAKFWALDVEMTLGSLAHVELSEPRETKGPTGTKVVIDGFAEAPDGLGGDVPLEKLTGTFGLYLQNHGAHLRFGEDEIDPAAIQEQQSEFKVRAGTGSTEVEAHLVVVEWSRKVDRALFLCTDQGVPVSEQQAGIQAPGFEFTAYLYWDGFAEDKALAIAELGSGTTKELIDGARDLLRSHFKQRADDKSREVIGDWKAEKVYPFEGDPDGTVEAVKRDVFDVVAVTAANVVNSTDSKSARRLSLRLLKQALENDPGSLQKVLTEVLELPQDRLDELSELLDRTPLTAMIATAKEISDRLEFLTGLETVVVGDDSKHIKERSQLHRILVGELWVFGEEYALSADDESLTRVLKKHLSILGREDLAADVSDQVLDSNGASGIVDLMLSRSLLQQRKKREHLVIELKRPSVVIGPDEMPQIEKYAEAVANDTRFNTQDVEWDFYIVAGKFKGMTEGRRTSGPQYGLVSEVDGIRIWCVTWADVIEDAGHRLKFVQGLLDYQPDAEQALGYLRKTHAKYLPKQVLGGEGDDAPKPVDQ